MFPDPTDANQYRAGFETSAKFTEHKLEKLVSGDHTLISKSSNRLLKDWEEDNFIKKFVLCTISFSV